MKTIFASEEDVKNNNKQEMMDIIKAREITSEILRFGVNNSQIQQIIKLLSLELEDRNQMLKIVEVLNDQIETSVKPKLNIEL